MDNPDALIHWKTFEIIVWNAFIIMAKEYLSHMIQILNIP